MLTDDYRVRLDAFEGPLDLLLHLIRRAEVEITDIPIATIADQFLEHLREIDRVDIEVAGEFLVMAATLMELKSRMLMPPVTDGDGAEGEGDGANAAMDPRAELIEQLLAYKRYRDAAEALEDLQHTWQRRYPAAPACIEANTEADGTDDEVEIDDLDLVDLVECFSRIIESVDFARVGEHTVTYDDTPIELHAADMVDSLGRSPEAAENGEGLPIVRLFNGRTRSEALGLFLALLELVRQRRVRVRQDDRTIRLWLCPEEPEQPHAED